jgi:hypothetical protein
LDEQQKDALPVAGLPPVNPDPAVFLSVSRIEASSVATKAAAAAARRERQRFQRRLPLGYSRSGNAVRAVTRPGVDELRFEGNRTNRKMTTAYDQVPH